MKVFVCLNWELHYKVIKKNIFVQIIFVKTNVMI